MGRTFLNHMHNLENIPKITEKNENLGKLGGKKKKKKKQETNQLGGGAHCFQLLYLTTPGFSSVEDLQIETIK